MKTKIVRSLLILASLMLLGIVTSAEKPPVKEVGDYCDGYKEGYKNGYCYEIVGCIEPTPPLCPTPRVGESTYKHGYNRGFAEGKEERDDSK